MKSVILALTIISTLIVTDCKLGQNTPFTDIEIRTAGIKKDDKEVWIIEDGVFDPNTYIASANYTVGLETIGWDLLAITTNVNFDDAIQAEAAGRLEGYLTRERIWNHWRNLNAKASWSGESTLMPEYIRNFFLEQEEYIEEMYKKDPEDAIFSNAYYLLRQFKGLREAYQQFSPENQQIDSMNFHTMSSFGDLFEIVHYKKNTTRDFTKWSTEKLNMYILENNHCSAIFKVKEDLSDIYFGHNSWFTFSATTRIFKEYNFNFKHPAIKSRNILFSSYPATLASSDDYYVTSQDLAIIETTNVLFNDQLLKLLTPRSLLTWQRAMIASRLSTTAKEWVENFAKENSGTYNNMFMALDMKKVDTEKKKIMDEAMYIVEQLPGTVDINDVTKYLKRGYWPSYNTPFSKTIKELSKVDEQIKSHPESANTLDYHTCARANIFRRDQGKVKTMEDFKKLLRYNDYQNDKLSLNDPTYTIACRGDLKRSCSGAYDAKVSSVQLAKGRKKTINIIMGPSNDTQPTFKWSESANCKNNPHFGLPEEYNFSWYTYQSQFVDELAQPDHLNFLE